MLNKEICKQCYKMRGEISKFKLDWRVGIMNCYRRIVVYPSQNGVPVTASEAGICYIDEDPHDYCSFKVEQLMAREQDAE
jgi:hypothetical protein